MHAPRDSRTMNAAIHLSLDEFLELLVERRRFSRVFDRKEGVCRMRDLVSGEEYCISSHFLDRCQVVQLNARED